MSKKKVDALVNKESFLACNKRRFVFRQDVMFLITEESGDDVLPSLGLSSLHYCLLIEIIVNHHLTTQQSFLSYISCKTGLY